MSMHGIPDQDPRRRELRRPMAGPTPDDLARGMHRMDPFGNQDYGNYGSGGNPYMVIPPPLPAPSADGWSSGENQFDVYGHHQHHNHMPAYQNQPQMLPQWNLQATEFVPKSNLSAAAAEFVPRNMARNTSQWGYQNQPQPAHQEGYYQNPPQTMPSYSSGPRYCSENSSVVNPYLESTESQIYRLDEQLTDSIATIVFMPSKLDRTCSTLATSINRIEDPVSLASLAETLVDLGFGDESFRPMSGQVCANIAKNVDLNFDGCTLISLLVERCRNLSTSISDILSTNSSPVNSIVEFVTNFFFHLDAYGSKEIDGLADILHVMFNGLLTVGTASKENLELASKMLKICGRALEKNEKLRNGDPSTDEAEIAARQTPKLDKLMSLVSEIAKNEKYPKEVKDSFQALLDARSSGTWGSECYVPALPLGSREAAKKGSNAITIEPDPNDARLNSNNVVISNNARNKARNHSSGQDMALTEEELAFMNEHMGADNSPGDSEVVGGSVSESGEEDEMNDDICAAYEEFLQEQKTGGEKK